MDSLSNGEQELVEQFVSITSYPGEPYTAIHYLQETDWNLERSILLYFERSPEANAQLNSAARRTTFPGEFPVSETLGNREVPQSGFRNLISSISAKISKWSGRNVQYLPLSSQDITAPRGFLSLNFSNQCFYVLQLVLYVPILSLYKLTCVIFLFLAKTFPILARYSQNRLSSKSEPKGIDPSHIARNFINDFNIFYKNDSDLDFYEGGYTSALFIAKRDARFLVVYLHNDEHEDTNDFVNETLLNEKTIKFFKDHNILVWGGDIHESESYQVSNALNASSFPFLGLLCLKSNAQETPEGTTQSAPTLTCVTRTQGMLTPDKLIEKFSSQIERLEPTLISIRSERQQQELSRVIRQQQDQAYQSSLARDRLLEETRRQERLLQTNNETFLKWRLSKLLPEVDANQKGEYSRIAIRLNNGERILRRFNKNASLEELYAYVELHQKGLLNTSTSNVERPANFTYKYPFNLLSVMPREEIAVSEDILIKDVSIVWPNGNLIVESLE